VRGFLKPVFTLILLSPVLAELISESSPAPVFFNPGTFVFLLVSYGVAVLVIREIAVRRRLSFGDIYIIGAAYGIFNEGFLAKTLIRKDHIPIPAFDHYGYFFGINFPWTATIILWHGIASVLFPILFTHLLFSRQSEELWLNRRLTNVIGIVLLVISCLSFLGKSNGRGTPVQLVILLGIMVVCVLIVAFRKRIAAREAAPAKLTWKPVLLGLGIFLFLVVTSLIAGKKLPVPLFFAALGLGVWIYVRILRRRRWVTARGLALFGIGCYLESAIMGTGLSVVMRRAAPEAAITGVMAVIALVWSARRILRAADLSPSLSPKREEEPATPAF